MYVPFMHLKGNAKWGTRRKQESEGKFTNCLSYDNLFPQNDFIQVFNYF